MDSVVNYDKLMYAGNLTNLASVADHPRYSFITANICDAAAVEAAMDGCETVVHFAAESHVDRSSYEPARAIATNVTGAFVLLQIARKRKIEKFIHVSTDEVYGDMEAGACTVENSALQPSSPYSASKASSDRRVRSYVRTCDFHAVITRASSNYVPCQFPEKFLPLMITNTLDGRPLPIDGDGEQERNWLHVQDHCRGILAVLERGHIGEVYDRGGPDAVENLSMARRVLRASGNTESLLSLVQDRPGHDRRYGLSWEKIEWELGWRPAVSLEDGLRQTLDWHRTNTEWIAGVRGGEYLTYYQKHDGDRGPSLPAIAESGRKSPQPLRPTCPFLVRRLVTR
jgi:dTDP-glucose 4,6-dehydratase